MTTKNIITLIASALVLFASCAEHKVEIHTTINEDGTCSRELMFTVDHHAKNDSIIPGFKDDSFECFVDSDNVRLDSSWNLYWTEKNDTVSHKFPVTVEDKKTIAKHFNIQPSLAAQTAVDSVVAHAKRDFSSITEMASNMPLVYNGKPYPVLNAGFSKSFKFFYTEYTYIETYDCIDSTFCVPLSRFIGEDEASFWLTGRPNLSEGLNGREQKEVLNGIEEKMNNWLVANLVYDLCGLIADSYDMVPDVPLSKAEFLSHRDSLVNIASKNNDDIWYKEHYLRDLFCYYFKTDAFNYIVEEGSESIGFDALFKNKYMMLSSKANYVLTMPGTIVEAGNGTIIGSDARYQLAPEYFLQKPYTITATSRVMNLWAYIVSLLVILLAIGSLMYKRKK